MIINVNARGDILFPEEFDARSALEANERGYLSHVIVSMSDRSRYPIFFIEPIRLKQELEICCTLGDRFFAEVGLVVVPDLSLETLTAAVRRLIEKGYFGFLRTIDDASNPWDV